MSSMWEPNATIGGCARLPANPLSLDDKSDDMNIEIEARIFGESLRTDEISHSETGGMGIFHAKPCRLRYV